MGCCCGALRSQVAPKRADSDPQSWLPSSLTLKSGTPTIKDFAEIPVERPYTGEKKILVCCTTKYLLEMKNGKFFNTGHQASETFVPLYHFDKCGFKIDIATPDGSAVAIEEWTFPMAVGYEDKLREIQAKLKDKLTNPMQISDVPTDLASYAAIFLPGGHGPVIEQHKIEALGALLRSAHDKGLPTISLCHGPSALRSASLGGEFPYKGYKLVVFPDKVDRLTPKLGYLPGYMKDDDLVEAKLKALGCEVQNREMDASTCVDRELITGASQKASQTLSVAAVKVLASKYDFKLREGKEKVLVHSIQTRAIELSSSQILLAD